MAFSLYSRVKTLHRISVGKLERSDYLGDIDIDGKMTLKWNLKKQDIMIWTGFIWLMHIGIAVPFGCSNEPVMEAE